MVYKHKGNWECMDHERDVVHLNKLWTNGDAFWKKWNWLSFLKIKSFITGNTGFKALGSH